MVCMNLCLTILPQTWGQQGLIAKFLPGPLAGRSDHECVQCLYFLSQLYHKGERSSMKKESDQSQMFVC